MPVNLRIDVSIDLHDVRPAVIVEIDKPTAPCDKLVVDSDSRRKRSIGESPIGVVVIEVASVVCKVCLENIEPSIAVVVAHGQAHPSLLMPILAIGATGHYGDVVKSTVAIVAEQDARFRVHRHVNVGPAVVIEVTGNRGNGIPRAWLQ